MSYPSQKVVYNACFGGFSLPIGVLHEMFRRCPPSTEAGQKIFWARRKLPLPESSTTFFGPYVLFSSGEYVGDLNTLEIYSLRSYNINALRTNPEFHALLEEMRVIGVPLNDHTRLEIAEVPYGCSHKIVEEDGKEQVVVEVPWKAVMADLLLIARGGGKLSWNPLTDALLADEKWAKKFLSDQP